MLVDMDMCMHVGMDMCMRTVHNVARGAGNESRGAPGESAGDAGPLDSELLEGLLGMQREEQAEPSGDRAYCKAAMSAGAISRQSRVMSRGHLACAISWASI